MKYDRFENLPVWKTGIDLGLRVFALTEDQAFSASGGLKDQIRRAAVSVSNNIAEGLERGSTAELLAFLYISRGSAGEVRSMLRFLDCWPPAAHLQSEISDLIPLAESCSCQLRGWADNLQNTDIKGQRHLNNATRAQYESQKRAEEFRATLAANQEQVVARWKEKLKKPFKAPNAPSAPEGT